MSLNSTAVQKVTQHGYENQWSIRKVLVHDHRKSLILQQCDLILLPTDSQTRKPA